MSAALAIASRSFNPRAREGRDEGVGARDLLVLVSIRAPVKGATPDNYDASEGVRFQSARP